ncbi:MAG: hypothetical protein AAF637_22460, partial [Pseudomonadota bacterium]
ASAPHPPASRSKPGGNKAISALAGENVIGKSDHDLVWHENADALVAVDKDVLRTGKTHYLHEYVSHSVHGKSTLNVCKFIGDLDGRRLVFGISFIIDE